MKPTKTSYDEFQYAFDHFNKTLFFNELPECLITMQRKKKACGYFSRKRFISIIDSETTDEIAMNPAYFATESIEGIMQTLVHEMAHLWQFHYGKPGRRNYHNKEWAAKMEEIGLMPSSTGKPGGKKTGESMSDYVIEGGNFQHSCNKLLSQSFKITWMDRYPSVKNNQEIPNFIKESFEIEEGAPGLIFLLEGNKSNRVKYFCPGCKLKVWGKPKLNLKCGDCNKSLGEIG